MIPYVMSAISPRSHTQVAPSVRVLTRISLYLSSASQPPPQSQTWPDSSARTTSSPTSHRAKSQQPFAPLSPGMYTPAQPAAHSRQARSARVREMPSACYLPSADSVRSQRAPISRGSSLRRSVGARCRGDRARYSLFMKSVTSEKRTRLDTNSPRSRSVPPPSGSQPCPPRQGGTVSSGIPCAWSIYHIPEAEGRRVAPCRPPTRYTRERGATTSRTRAAPGNRWEFPELLGRRSSRPGRRVAVEVHCVVVAARRDVIEPVARRAGRNV